ncbi:glycosyltransferase family 4 protein [Haliangium sp.]|uniref:glycosyltransferase family 4 protein n=1 Tax=Haliangium sp. TaxID=2663208 RepID=UPI003D14B5A8
METLITTRYFDKLLRDIGRRPIVVVSDRYPPDTHGGAEVSLHIFLSALDNKDDVLVITFTEQKRLPESYEIDGVRVVSIPQQGAYPHHAWPKWLVPYVKPQPTLVQRRLHKLLERVLPFGATEASSHELAALDRLGRDLHPKGGVQSDVVAFPEGFIVACMRAILQSCHPALIHADNYRSIVAVALASRGLQAKRIGLVRDNRFHCVRHNQSVSIHGVLCDGCDFACASEDLEQAPALQAEMLRQTSDFRVACLRSMDRIIVTSQYLDDSIKRVLPSAQTVCIPNPPDDQGLSGKYMYGVAERPGTNLLVVGMLNENKGQFELVRRLDQLTQRIPDVVIHLAGRGARMERQIRGYLSKKQYEDRVIIHGYVDRQRLYELYRECQIIALPTIGPEGFGRVPLEAGLARRPVVAFSVGGLKESIIDGVTGAVVAPNDWETFIDKLAVLADDPELRMTQGEAALAHVLSNYGVPMVKERLVETWRSLLDDPPH